MFSRSICWLPRGAICSLILWRHTKVVSVVKIRSERFKQTVISIPLVDWMALLQKNQEILEAHIKVIDKEPRKHNFAILKELGQDDEVTDQESTEDAAKLEVNDQDQALFFGDEFSDCQPLEKQLEEISLGEEASGGTNEGAAEGCLIDYESFADFMSSPDLLMPSQLLMSDFSNESLMDSSLMELMGPSQPSNKVNTDLNLNPSKKTNDVSKWFNLFSDLDPLQMEHENASKNLHAA